MTGDRVIIVVDPLTSVECAQAALSFCYENCARKALMGMIYAHSHAYHLGGANGVFGSSDASFAPILATHSLDYTVTEDIHAICTILKSIKL